MLFKEKLLFDEIAVKRHLNTIFGRSAELLCAEAGSTRESKEEQGPFTILSVLSAHFTFSGT